MKYVIDKHRVINLMNDKGIKTQKKLAEKVGITPNQLSVVLSHDFNP
ncbi:helix-turn-helix domain-containing protein, partial [Lactobacillus taiwanensis]